MVGEKDGVAVLDVWRDRVGESLVTGRLVLRDRHLSQEYFDLLTAKPESSQWLALGNSVTFTLGSEVYEVYE